MALMAVVSLLFSLLFTSLAVLDAELGTKPFQLQYPSIFMAGSTLFNSSSMMAAERVFSNTLPPTRQYASINCRRKSSFFSRFLNSVTKVMVSLILLPEG